MNDVPTGNSLNPIVHISDDVYFIENPNIEIVQIGDVHVPPPPVTSNVNVM